MMRLAVLSCISAAVLVVGDAHAQSAPSLELTACQNRCAAKANWCVATKKKFLASCENDDQCELPSCTSNDKCNFGCVVCKNQLKYHRIECDAQLEACQSDCATPTTDATTA